MFRATWLEFYLLVVGNTDNTVKNSQHFAEFIRGQTLDADQMLVSFDVVSLFTKIPVDLAIKVATNRLRYDDSLWQRTSLPLEDITDLLTFCLNTTQFVFEGTYYKQVFGTAMGSPVSAVIANLVIEDIEHRALTTASVSPSFWKRFVDDVISAVSQDEIVVLLQHLNSIEPSIQFTVERETDEKLPFLDTWFRELLMGSWKLLFIVNQLILLNICHLTRITREAIKSLLLQLCFRERRI